MDGAIETPRGALVRCFAEFSLLPDLLNLYRAGEPRERTVEQWEGLLDAIGYNSDHLERRFIPDGVALTEFVAGDALRYCSWIELIDPGGGLSDAGARIADIAGKSFDERGEDESRTLTKTLAEQTQRHYVGADGAPLTDILQGACAVMASHGQPWDRALRGVLLAEMDTLLHWGFSDAATAESLARELPSYRQRVVDAMRGVPEALDEEGQIDPLQAAEVISEFHWRNPDLAQGSPLTTTGLKATAIAMVFAQLLSQSLEPVALQVLRPWVPA